MRPRAAVVLFCLGMLLAFVREGAAQASRPATSNDEVSAAEKAVKKKPKDAEAWLTLGISYFMAGRDTEAIPAFEKAMALDPGNLKDMPNYGLRTVAMAFAIRGYIKLGRFDDAIALAKRSLETVTERGPRQSAWFALGLCYYQAGRIDEAIAAHTEALKLIPTDAIVLTNLGHCYRAQGRHAEAAVEYEKAVKIEPDHPPAWRGLAECYEKLGRKEDAAAALEKAKKLDPGPVKQ